MIRSFQSVCAWMMILSVANGARAGATGTSSDPELNHWRGQIQSLIEQPRFRHAEWGIKVVSLDTDRTLFEHNAQKYFQVASNVKLFTAALALAQLGPDYRFRTTVNCVQIPDEQGVVHGDVIIIGQGDPTVSSHWTADDRAVVLQPLVAVFTNAGVRHIEGDLIGDESYFYPIAGGTGWMWEDLEHGYGAKLSALSFDGNTTKLRLAAASVAGGPCHATFQTADRQLQIINQSRTTDTDPEDEVSARRLLGTDTVVISGQMKLGSEEEILSVPVASPAQYFMDNLASSLQRQGISINGTVGVRSAPDAGSSTGTVLGSVQSPPLAEMVHEMLKESDNLSAALLFAHTGICQSSDRDQSPDERGVEALARFLAHAGLPANEVQIEEGSGMSRNSLTTPNAIVALLRHMRNHETASIFTAALPIAGVDGTLKERLHRTAAEGNLRAKTGTLRWAQALSGYATSKAGEPLAFSIILGRYLPAKAHLGGGEEVDALAEVIVNLKMRSSSR